MELSVKRGDGMMSNVETKKDCSVVPAAFKKALKVAKQNADDAMLSMGEVNTSDELYFLMSNILNKFYLEIARAVEDHIGIEGYFDQQRAYLLTLIQSSLQQEYDWGIAGTRAIAASVAYSYDYEKLFKYMERLATVYGYEMPPRGHAELAYEFAGFYESGELGKAEIVKKSIHRARKKPLVLFSIDKETLEFKFELDEVSKALNILPTKRGRPKKK